MSFPRYPEYKDSGVEWLGKVPGHWVTSRFSRVLLAIKDGTHGTFKRTSEGHPLLSAKNVSDGSIELGESESLISQEDHEEIVSNGFPRAGDLLLTIVGTIGRACVYSFSTSYAFQRSVCFLRFKTGMSSDYFYYLTQSKFFQEQLISRSKSSAQAGVYMGDIAACSILFPSERYEQDAIVRFLNSETIKIDSLIAEQEKLIALLKEKRQAVIAHAVTKGLDSTVPMKDSEIEWLGEVPADWAMKRLKNISSFITVGVVVNPSEYVAEEGLPFIYGGDISEGAITWESARCITREDSEKNAKTQLSAGDLLTVRVGAPGITAVVSTECAGGNCASVMLTKSGNFDSDWLCYAMNSRVVRYQVEVVQYGAAQEQFNISHAINFWVPTPPRLEQTSIAKFLKRETGKFDDLIGEAQHAIDLLKERRTALISAAVTGQIDVRGLIKEEQEQAA